MKKTLVIAALIFTPLFASALEYTLLEPITGFLPVTAPPTLEQYFIGMFRFVIGIAGILAVIRITWCGLKVMTSTSPSAREEAKECVKSALFGLLLAFGSFMIINSVNNRLLDPVNIPLVPARPGDPVGVGGAPAGSPVCILSSSNMNLFEGQTTNISVRCYPEATSYTWTISGGAPTVVGAGGAVTFPTAGVYTYTVIGINDLGAGQQSRVLTIRVVARTSGACIQDMPQEVTGPISCAQPNTAMDWSALGSGTREEKIVLGNDQSVSIQFTTAGAGAYGSFVTKGVTVQKTIMVPRVVDPSTNPPTTVDEPVTVKVPENTNSVKYANISKAACDFRYENLDRRLCAVTGTDLSLAFQIGGGNPPPSTPPGCILEPNTAYVINIRNENPTNPGINTCSPVDTCEFVGTFTQSQASQFTPVVPTMCTVRPTEQATPPTFTFRNLLEGASISAGAQRVEYSASDPGGITLIEFSVYNTQTGRLVDNQIACTDAGIPEMSVPACGDNLTSAENLTFGPNTGTYQVIVRICSNAVCATQSRTVTVQSGCAQGTPGLTCLTINTNTPLTTGEICSPQYGTPRSINAGETHAYKIRLGDGEVGRLLVANRPMTSCPYTTPTGSPNPTPTPPSPSPTPVTPKPPADFTPPSYPPLTGGMTEVRPAETTQLLHNPGIGVTYWWMSNNDRPRGVVLYRRWYWNEFEPQEGQYNWAGTFDRAIEEARANGWTIDWRIMPNVPDWMAAQGVASIPIPGGGYGETNIADHNNPVFMAGVERALRAISERYGDAPEFNMVDVGFVGRWGEWHNYFPAQQDLANSYLPTPENARRIVDWHFQYFPNTPKTVLVGYLSTFNDAGNALPRGTGWRGDCYGDLTWHHPSLYRGIASGIAANAWQNGPVSMEICGENLTDWPGWVVNSEADIDLILREAQDWHTSTINLKDHGIPPEWLGKLDEWLKYIGYRFAPNFIQHTASVAPGGQLAMQTYWINRGVAPSYHQYPIAYRLRSSSGQIVAQWESAQDIRLWLPGFHRLDDTFTVPGGVAAGTYSLDVAMLNKRAAGNPPLELALGNRGGDGWYNVSTVNVQ
jgi:hypothetical protein